MKSFKVLSNLILITVAVISEGVVIIPRSRETGN